jgi:hypothetical protein
MRKFIILVLAILVLTSLANQAGAQCQVNFNSTSGVAVGSNPDGLVAGDFNRDGSADLAVVNKGSNNVSILLNQGGVFSVAGTYSVGSAPNTIVAADYNKDGKIDLAVTNQNSNTFTLMRGNGDGSFVSGFTFTTQAQPTALTFADFNTDGSQDIAVLTLGSQSISIFFGDGTGTFINSLNISHTQFRGGNTIAAADLNLDGTPDIIASGLLNSGGFDYQTLITVLGIPAGGFSTFNFNSATGWVADVADFEIADLNRDGKPDYVVSVSTTFQGDVRYTIGRGNGTGAFPPGNIVSDVPAFGGRTGSTAVGDFNSDGKLDLAFSQANTDPTNNLFILQGDGNAAFPSPAVSFGVGGGNAQKIIAADFNGDGKPDIASTNSVQNSVNITLNTCGGLKTSPPKVDFDGDGKTDLAIFRPSMGEWWYLKSSTGGNVALQFGNSSDKLTPGDFTGDGKIDIAYFRPSTGFWFILRSEDFSFYSFPFGATGDIASTGDYDGDGKTDAAVFRPSDSVWYIRRSSDGGTTIRQFGQAGDIPVAGD